MRTFSQVTCETTPSHYNGAILKKLDVFLKNFEVFAFDWEAERKKSVLAVLEALLKLSGICGVREMGCEVRGTGCG